MADIYIFGDSIGYGAWDEKGGWADRLKQYFHQQKLANPNKKATEVYNLSVDGDNSADVAVRLKSELTARRKPWSTNEDIVLMAIGTNDAYAEGSPTNYPFSPDDYLENLKKIHQDVQLLGLRLTFLSLDPVDEDQTNPTPWGAYFWTNDKIAEYNRTLKQFCEDNGLPFLNIFDELLNKSDYKEMLYDGTHPNSTGHEYIFGRVTPFINGLLVNS